MADQPSSEAVKQQVARRFNSSAATYHTGSVTRNAAHRLVASVPFRPGQRTLDLAVGTGHVAIAAAQRVSPNGTVTGVDIAQEMVEECRKNALAARVTNLDVRVGDAEKLNFHDASFDIVTCGLGIFFLPDQAGALREWHRVLKPGGTVHFSAWGVEFDEPQRSALRAQLATLGLDAKGTGTVSPLPQAEACEQVLRAAGFTEVAVVVEQAGAHFSDPNEYWTELARGYLAHLEPDARFRFEAEHRAGIVGPANAKGIWRNAPVNIASGRKP